MHLKVIVLCVVVGLAGQSVQAQKAEGGGGKKDKAAGEPAMMKKGVGDAMGENMVPPHMLLGGKGGAAPIDLTQQQKGEIQELMEQAQGQSKELQQKLAQEMSALSAILAADRVDEPKALEQLDRVADAERQIKRQQLALLMSIKNKLTPEQLAKVREVRAEQARRAAEKAREKQAAQPPPEGGAKGKK